MELLRELQALLEDLSLSVDNPGGEWLKHKQKTNDEAGTRPSGAPRLFGPVTATFSRYPLIPVDVLAKIKGVNDEQIYVRDDSLSGLMKLMGKTGELPRMTHNSDHQYAPFITVYQDGTPWMSEGNHRVMAAKKLGWKYMPVEIRYFSGAEKASGILSPAKVKTFDAEASAAGFMSGNKFHANPVKKAA